MNIYTCTQFTGYWPVGVAAVVSAESKERAVEILNNTLRLKYGLDGDASAEDMQPIPVGHEYVRVLRDGNY